MYEIKPMGDKCLSVNFEQAITDEINAQVRSFYKALMKRGANGIIEATPAYSSVAVFYEPSLLGYGEASELCEKILKSGLSADEAAGKVFEIPVLYGEEHGPDLNFVAQVNNITEDEVIKIHSSKPYLIYMLGFAPGFCYLGGMDKAIAAPRKEVPRQKITPGSVGIAGEQTGMYPIESPGGWQLIGRTPVKLYDPLRIPPVIYNSGDYIKYKSISKAEYAEIQNLESKGMYKSVSYGYSKL